MIQTRTSSKEYDFESNQTSQCAAEEKLPPIWQTICWDDSPAGDNLKREKRDQTKGKEREIGKSIRDENTIEAHSRSP
jgi:hypothetical protein